MSNRFDPYHEWLGITPSEQLPHYYRLLAITRFEENPTVIQNAADRQMASLRMFQAGKHSAESQRLLNEVAAARICLLNPAKKPVYDQWLREKIQPPPPPRQPQGATSNLGWAWIGELGSRSAAVHFAGRRARQPRTGPPRFGAATALAVAAIGLALWWAMGQGDTPSDGSPAKADPAAPAKAAKEVTPKPFEKKGRPATPINPEPESKPDVPPVAKPSEPVKPEAKAGSKTATKKEKTAWHDEQERLWRNIGELCAPSGPEDQTPTLPDDGHANEANRTEQFPVPPRAVEKARLGNGPVKDTVPRRPATPGTPKPNLDAKPPAANNEVTVVRAVYGVPDKPSKQIDVTSILRDALAKDRFSPIQADHRAGDPALGERKRLRVWYRYANILLPLDLSQSDVAVLPPFPPNRQSRRIPSKTFAIVAARYGAGLTWIDVTKGVASAVADPRKPFLCTNFGATIDPWPGVRKHVAIWFDYDGDRYVRAFLQGETHSLLP